ncbi:uncharacterized protein MONOS_15692 [Monocercomonoides exilis]|uniref:uncharacterized protein n=1 Tax=Monocercomonoides exilis TaxID=2049356 RepID=UPI00355A870C|nr:hypothetical protein MONOS_15692 [Monocercomonoides exilis]|eukprot:MONOS_15692.1-p1 / transcript=MONOS_15692.1 / gene=MONOS_15692 / organism=Monocercomonoides_exilis_PA203 / gene_product=unspecified product / transcript_product=unspecified product / location=Mono_scaffold01313:3424-3657(+) / protein_length=78 / sequence_SO=supercontig / SO=protein_coding / is_pseudo=false
MERKMRGGGGGEKGWNMIKRQKRIIVKVSAETVREPCVCWKRADEADGSGEEDVDDDEDDDENDDADCDDWECEFDG